jgi:TRAP-type C4-dicarboxylate transport system permease small subunit
VSQKNKKEKTIFNKLERFIVHLNGVTHSISIIIVFMMMVITFSDVIGRYFFRQPVLGTYELTELGLAIMVFFSMGYTQLKKGHTSIGIIVDRWSDRKQALLDSVVYLITVLLMLVTAWQMTKYAQLLKAGNGFTGELSLPVYIFVFISSLGLFIFALSLSIDLFKSLHRVVKRDES